MRRAPSVAALLLVATVARVLAQPAVLRGPAVVGGPAAVSGAPTVPTVPLPVGGTSDVFCPATVPTRAGSTTIAGTMAASPSCVSSAAPTTVVAISFFADANGPAGVHQKCSVYTFPGGYVNGTTSIPKLASGCDTVEWTSTANQGGWVTLNTTGTCTLAPSTRYLIACNQDNGFFMGYSSSSGCTVGGVQCYQYATSAYASGLPASWIATNQTAGAMMYYLNVR